MAESQYMTEHEETSSSDKVNSLFSLWNWSSDKIYHPSDGRSLRFWVHTGILQLVYNYKELPKNAPKGNSTVFLFLFCLYI